MIIKNGQVLDETFHFVKKDLYILNDEIVSEETYQKKAQKKEEEIIQAEVKYVFPGFVDIHVHGCHDRDFCDANPDSIADFMAFEASKGITAVCPTTMTVAAEKLLRVAEAASEYRKDVKDNPGAHETEATFIGINMEGPFISPQKKGSQEESDILKPDAAFIHEMQKKSKNAVRLVDYAPEMEGAEEMVKALTDEVILSIAHSNADYDTARAAIQSGVRHITHLYNAMTPYTHRAPGIVGAASDDETCMVELIADGLHNHPSVVRNTFRIFGSKRIVLISDSMRATGMPDGEYEFGGHRVTVTGKRALLQDGTIAASVTNLYDCMKTCVKEMGIPLEEAVRCASYNPALSVGEETTIGSLVAGRKADILLADPATLNLETVILHGKRQIVQTA